MLLNSLMKYWQLCNAGIRYLDIRVGYYPDREDKFWLNHNYARVNPLRFLLEDLKNFLEGYWFIFFKFSK